MKHIFNFLFCLIALQGIAQDSSIIALGKKIHISSAILHEKRPLLISLPENYHQEKYAGQHYPVLYLLDGEINFNAFAGIVQFLSRGFYSAVPQMIVVGIENTDRTRDLTPTHVEDETNAGQVQKGGSYKMTGGEENFLHFIKEEVMAYVDSHYRTAPFRIFSGHSFGGLTVLDCFVRHPDYFQAYISMDPSLWWDHGQEMGKIRQMPRASLFRSLYLTSSTLSGGSKEDANGGSLLDSCNTLFTQKSKDQNFRFTYRHWEDETHGTIAIPSLYYGLKDIFAGYQTNGKLFSHPAEYAKQVEMFFHPYQITIPVPGYALDGIGQMSLQRHQPAVAVESYRLMTEKYPLQKYGWQQLAQAAKAAQDTAKMMYSTKKLQFWK